MLSVRNSNHFKAPVSGAFFYSNLKASIGFSFAAFLAGIIPKIKPIEIEESTAISTDFTVITAWIESCT